MTRLLLDLYPECATDQKQWFRIRFRIHELHSRLARVNEAPGLF